MLRPKRDHSHLRARARTRGQLMPAAPSQGVCRHRTALKTFSHHAPRAFSRVSATPQAPAGAPKHLCPFWHGEAGGSQVHRLAQQRAQSSARSATATFALLNRADGRSAWFCADPTALCMFQHESPFHVGTAGLAQHGCGCRPDPAGARLLRAVCTMLASLRTYRSIGEHRCRAPRHSAATRCSPQSVYINFQSC